MLAIMVFGNAGDKCWQSYFPEMPAINNSYYNFQKCWRHILPNRKLRNAGDKYHQLIFRKWRRMLTITFSEFLAIIIFRNAGDTCWQS